MHYHSFTPQQRVSEFLRMIVNTYFLKTYIILGQHDFLCTSIQQMFIEDQLPTYFMHLRDNKIH